MRFVSSAPAGNGTYRTYGSLLERTVSWPNHAKLVRELGRALPDDSNAEARAWCFTGPGSAPTWHDKGTELQTHAISGEN